MSNNPVPPPPLTVVPEAQRVADGIERTAQAASQRLLKGGTPFTDITVCIGFLDENGNRQEIVQTLDATKVRIVSCLHGVEEKMKMVKDSETGDNLGFEPTGEYILQLKAKYIKE